MSGEQAAPARTDFHTGRARMGPEVVRFRRPPAPNRRLTDVGVVLLLMVVALISGLMASFGAAAETTVDVLMPTIASDGLNVSRERFEVAGSEAPTKEGPLEPQALSLTTQQLLAESPTAAASVPTGDQPEKPADDHEASPAALQLLPEPSLAPGQHPEGRRRRRLGRKRKRRPLQDDYWGVAAEGKPTDDSDPESTGAAGRMSDRKRLPYAGAAASRWEGINKPASAQFRSGLHHQQQQQQPQPHHHRANDWMNNPYTDAISAEQRQQQTMAAPIRRRPYEAPAGGGNFSPIEPNRARRISSSGTRTTLDRAALATTPPSNPGKAYRKPYSQARRSEEQFSSPEGSSESGGSSPSSQAADLKALLKQSDGLSLSEILQQRNISLQDLIKGKQMALAALTQSPPPGEPNGPFSTVLPAGLDGSDGASTTVPPTLSSVRFRLLDDASTVIDGSGLTTTESPGSGARGSVVSTVRPQPPEDVPEDDTSNSVDELDGPAGVVSIFPTVEIKQLALNPVLPIVKEERLRPIKGVASRIRPDLSNTHIRTSEPARFPGASGLPGGKRLPAASSSSSSVFPVVPLKEEIAPATTVTTPPPSGGSATGAPPNPTVPSLLLITSTAREKWTPSASLVGQRQRLNHATGPVGRQSQATTTTSQPASTSFVSSKEEGRLGSAEATSMLPEAEAMVELLTPERGHYQHQPLLRVPKLKTRIAIKPRLTNVVLPKTEAYTPPSTTSTTMASTTKASVRDRFNLSDVELRDDEDDGAGPEQPRRQQRLHNDGQDDDEPELNIIEKFTSFGDPASPSSSLEGKGAPPPGVDEREAVADLVGRISEHTQRSFTDSLEEFYRDVTESNPSLFNDLSPIASSDDRRELLELMEDRRIGARLAKVLSQRNMTLEQLLEHRRRGSSQLHLAEFVAGKAKPIDDRIDIVTAFEHFPRFNIGNLRSIRPDDIKQDSQGFSYFTSIINLRPASTGDDGDGIDEGYNKQDGRARALPPSSTAHRHRGHGGNGQEVHFLASGGSKAKLLVPSRISANGPVVYGSSGSNYEGEGAGQGATGHDLLDLELSGHGFQHHRSPSVTIESTAIPVGVRSAIVASSAIVGVSLAIFVAIFVTCRLRQRRHQKLNYTENFHMAKGRLPIIHGASELLDGRTQSGSDRSSNSGPEEQVVYTTHRALGGAGPSLGLGTSSHDGGTGRTRQHVQAPGASLMDPNSVEVQDYLWDRKPFQ